MPQEFDVFLSHSSNDKAWARKLKNDLQNYGVSAWLDEDEILPGELFAKALERALDASRIVALIVTPEAVASNWVMQEYYSTLQSVPIIPLILRDAELPRFLQGRMWVDFQDETKYDQNVRQLVKGITGEEPVQTRSEDINEFIIFLDEITREDRSKGPRYKFIDPEGYIERLVAERHHVIFGRRGSGKSVFLRALENECGKHRIKPVLIDLGVANVSYPNVIVIILIGIFNQLREVVVSERSIQSKIPFTNENRLVKDLEDVVRSLDEQYSQPPELIQGVSETFGLRFENYRKLIKEWRVMMGAKAIFLLVDDFYQVQQIDQPKVADFLNKLFSGLPCYLKIGTVPSRSRLIDRNGLSVIGLQSEHHYSPINLDFLLKDFERARGFLSHLFDNICQDGMEDFYCDAIFEDKMDGMNILTESSGGNPRSFINLLKGVLSIYRMSQTSVGYSDIRRVSVTYTNRVHDEISSKDSISLNRLLKEIVKLCQSYQDIGFYITKEDINAYPALYALIGELVDAQLINLLTKTYPPPVGDCSVHVLSVGVYNDINDPDGYFEGESLVNRINNKKKEYPRLDLSQLHRDILNPTVT